jgi:hypothetical protein
MAATSTDNDQPLGRPATSTTKELFPAFKDAVRPNENNLFPPNASPLLYDSSGEEDCTGVRRRCSVVDRPAIDREKLTWLILQKEVATHQPSFGNASNVAAIWTKFIQNQIRAEPTRSRWEFAIPDNYLGYASILDAANIVARNSSPYFNVAFRVESGEMIVAPIEGCVQHTVYMILLAPKGVFLSSTIGCVYRLSEAVSSTTNTSEPCCG